MSWFKRQKLISLTVALTLLIQQSGFAQAVDLSQVVSQMMPGRFLQESYRPVHLRGLGLDESTGNFNLLLDKGTRARLDVDVPHPTSHIPQSEILFTYFLTGLTLPNDVFWVNLRPDGEDNIIDSELAQTDLGKEMLAADLQLKKDTARLTSPETTQGKIYWEKLYAKAAELFGTSEMTIPTMIRPWIVPDEVIIREANGEAYIYKATLKVMLEEDHLSVGAGRDLPLKMYSFEDERLKQLNQYAAELARAEIIPQLTREVNTSEKYAPLKQVYYSLILAQWFKAYYRDKQTGYSQMIDSHDLAGLTSEVSWSVQEYFDAYKQSFQQGEHSSTMQLGGTLRNFISGGVQFGATAASGISPTGAIPGIAGVDFAASSALAAVRMDARGELSVASTAVRKEESGSITPEHMNPIKKDNQVEQAVAAIQSMLLEKRAGEAVEMFIKGAVQTIKQSRALNLTISWERVNDTVVVNVKSEGALPQDVIRNIKTNLEGPLVGDGDPTRVAMSSGDALRALHTRVIFNLLKARAMIAQIEGAVIEFDKGGFRMTVPAGAVAMREIPTPDDTGQPDFLSQRNAARDALHRAVKEAAGSQRYETAVRSYMREAYSLDEAIFVPAGERDAFVAAVNMVPQGWQMVYEELVARELDDVGHTYDVSVILGDLQLMTMLAQAASGHAQPDFLRTTLHDLAEVSRLASYRYFIGNGGDENGIVRFLAREALDASPGRFSEISGLVYGGYTDFLKSISESPAKPALIKAVNTVVGHIDTRYGHTYLDAGLLMQLLRSDFDFRFLQALETAAQRAASRRFSPEQFRRSVAGILDEGDLTAQRTEKLWEFADRMKGSEVRSDRAHSASSAVAGESGQIQAGRIERVLKRYGLAGGGAAALVVGLVFGWPAAQGLLWLAGGVIGHYAGHILAARASGKADILRQEMQINPFEYADYRKDSRRVFLPYGESLSGRVGRLVALAGPGVNLALAAALFAADFGTGGMVNLLLGGYNLLPVKGMDGAQVWQKGYDAPGWVRSLAMSGEEEREEALAKAIARAEERRRQMEELVQALEAAQQRVIENQAKKIAAALSAFEDAIVSALTDVVGKDGNEITDEYGLMCDIGNVAVGEESAPPSAMHQVVEGNIPATPEAYADAAVGMLIDRLSDSGSYPEFAKMTPDDLNGMLARLNVVIDGNPLPGGAAAAFKAFYETHLQKHFEGVPRAGDTVSEAAIPFYMPEKYRVAAGSAISKKNLTQIEADYLARIAHAVRPDELKRIYRKMAAECHPDANNGSTEAAEVFKRLSALIEDKARDGFGQIPPDYTWNAEEVPDAQSSVTADALRKMGLTVVSTWAMGGFFSQKENDDVTGAAVNELQKRVGAVREYPKPMQGLLTAAVALPAGDIEALLDIPDQSVFPDAVKNKLGPDSIREDDITSPEFRASLEKILSVKSLGGGEIVHVRMGNEIFRAVVQESFTHTRTGLQLLEVTAPFGLIFDHPNRIIGLDATAIVSPLFDIEKEPVQIGYDVAIGDQLELNLEEMEKQGLALDVAKGGFTDTVVTATVIAAIHGSYGLVARERIHDYVGHYLGRGLDFPRDSIIRGLAQGSVRKVVAGGVRLLDSPESAPAGRTREIAAQEDSGHMRSPSSDQMPAAAALFFSLEREKVVQELVEAVYRQEQEKHVKEYRTYGHAGPIEFWVSAGWFDASAEWIQDKISELGLKPAEQKGAYKLSEDGRTLYIDRVNVRYGDLPDSAYRERMWGKAGVAAFEALRDTAVRWKVDWRELLAVAKEVETALRNRAIAIDERFGSQEHLKRAFLSAAETMQGAWYNGTKRDEERKRHFREEYSTDAQLEVVSALRAVLEIAVGLGRRVDDSRSAPADALSGETAYPRLEYKPDTRAQTPQAEQPDKKITDIPAEMMVNAVARSLFEEYQRTRRDIFGDLPDWRMVWDNVQAQILLNETTGYIKKDGSGFVWVDISKAEYRHVPLGIQREYEDAAHAGVTAVWRFTAAGGRIQVFADGIDRLRALLTHTQGRITDINTIDVSMREALEGVVASKNQRNGTASFTDLTYDDQLYILNVLYTVTASMAPSGKPSVTKKLRNAAQRIFSRSSSAVSEPALDSTVLIPDTDKGGIDFHSIPAFKIPAGGLLGLVDLNAPEVLTADAQGIWRELNELVDADVEPDSTQIKLYVSACLREGTLEERVCPILCCIARSLRIEEDLVKQTDPELKDLLVALETSGAQGARYAMNRKVVQRPELRGIGVAVLREEEEVLRS